MTMHVKLSPELEKYIKDRIASGFYKNSTEVIGEAICRMKEQEERTGPQGVSYQRSDTKPSTQSQS